MEYRFSLIPLKSAVSCLGKGIRCTYRQIRDAEYTLAPRFVPLSGLVAEHGRAGCNETIVERKNEKEFLACLRNRDRAGPGRAKIHVASVYVASLIRARDCPVRALIPASFLSLPLSSFAPFLPALSVSISSCWTALDSRANSLRFAPKPQKFLGDGFLLNSRRKMPNGCARRAG